ncbi:MAG TPA: YraN family protein [Candidatus Binatia bacterium]|nr:YraN family protein [Candidatus Binatia bacterium]
MSWITRLVVRGLQKALARSRSGRADHLALGKRGESEAYFYLQRLGYRFVATNFRVPNDRGEIDLIGWDKDVLCFIEVKTRTDDSFAPPSTAVNAGKQRHILSVAKRYLRRLPRGRIPSCRFDIVSIVPSPEGGSPQFELRKGAFSWDNGRRRERQYRDFPDRHFWRSRR